MRPTKKRPDRESCYLMQAGHYLNGGSPITLSDSKDYCPSPVGVTHLNGSKYWRCAAAFFLARIKSRCDNIVPQLRNKQEGRVPGMSHWNHVL